MTDFDLDRHALEEAAEFFRVLLDDNLELIEGHPELHGHAESTRDNIHNALNGLTQHPITRIYAGFGEVPSPTTLSVQDLMDENADFEDSGWWYLRTLLEEGQYDDSDPKSQVYCLYVLTGTGAELIAQATQWYEDNEAFVSAADLEHPSSWNIST